MISINCIRSAKAPFQTFVSVTSILRSRDSSSRIVSSFGRKLSSSLVTLKVVSSMAYEKELDAAKKAASLAARLCQKVQKDLLQSDVQSKSDKSPVTVADYGSQAIVSLVLERELDSEPLSLVAEEDSGDLRKDGSKGILKRITKLVNNTLATEDLLTAIDSRTSFAGSILSTDDILRAMTVAHLKVVQMVNIGFWILLMALKGTYMQPLNSKSDPVKVQVSSVENPEEASFFESFEGSHSLHDLSSSIANKLGVKAPPVRIDSQAKYGALSRGDGAIYLRFPHKGYREKIWDHVAGSIVVTEAGGIVTDAAGKPLDFSKGKYLDLKQALSLLMRS